MKYLHRFILTFSLVYAMTVKDFIIKFCKAKVGNYPSKFDNKTDFGRYLQSVSFRGESMYIVYVVVVFFFIFN